MAFIYWQILSNKKILLEYGSKLWRLITTQWRLFWLPVIRNIKIYNNFSISSPEQIFIDSIDPHHRLKICIRSGSMGQLKNICNEMLIPTTLCPWRCTEYFHQHGNIPIDILLQNLMRKFV